jgi:putative hydrolase of the HAD superfamily
VRSPPIEAVVFDFGGVIITPITHKMDALAVRHNTTVAQLVPVLLGPHESGDHPWHRAERGELAVAEIQALLAPWAQAAGMQMHGDEIDVLLAPGYRVIDEMVALIGSLRERGVRTALLTNTFLEFRPTLEQTIDFSLFDEVIESYAVAARKPEPAIYHATAEALAIPHDRIAYLDDFDQNLAPAVALGWTVIHVTDPLDAISALGQMLGVDQQASGYERRI